jgi:hypothetical protein
MQFPHIHINGTDAETLRDNYLKAMNAASALIDALRDCAPNGRDYYTISSDAASVAMTEHLARQRMADTVYRELQALAYWVIEQGAK